MFQKRLIGLLLGASLWPTPASTQERERTDRGDHVRASAVARARIGEAGGLATLERAEIATRTRAFR